MSYPFDYSTIQRTLLMASSLTIGEYRTYPGTRVNYSILLALRIVMSQLDLSEETMVFYRLIMGVTICAVL